MPDGALPPQTLRDTAGLITAGFVAAGAAPVLDRVAERYAVAIPPALAALITHPDDPIGRQFIPHPANCIPRRTNVPTRSGTTRSPPCPASCTAMRTARC